MSKSTSRTIFFTALMLTSLLTIACGLGGLFAPEPTATPTSTATFTPTSTATATATLTPTPTTTSTPTPTATATFTSTPTPAIFSNRPSYMENIFSDSGWIWKNVSNGSRMGTRRHDYYTMIYVAYSSSQVGVGGIWNIDKGDKAFVDGFFPIALQDFLPPSTIEKIILFKNSNTEPGSYGTNIDGFKVSLAVKDDPVKNTRNLVVLIWEE